MKDFDLYPSLLLENGRESLPDNLKDIFAHPHISALRLEYSGSVPKALMASLIHLSQSHDVALILSPLEKFKIDSLLLEKSDGVHFRDVTSLKAGLPALKPFKLQVGCFCVTLDEAMYAGEAGADYVSFPAESSEIIEKWSCFAELPCVAEDPASVASALSAIQNGAEFVSFPLKGDHNDLEWINALTTE